MAANSMMAMLKSAVLTFDFMNIPSRATGQPRQKHRNEF
jgi:hypothetical protein